MDLRLELRPRFDQVPERFDPRCRRVDGCQQAVEVGFLLDEAGQGGEKLSPAGVSRQAVCMVDTMSSGIAGSVKL
ncbi:MAG TPA: hypothetical protein VES60_02310 [Nakamurella sp.]|nr:hypothetical protein [Nakamurella sp.]